MLVKVFNYVHGLEALNADTLTDLTLFEMRVIHVNGVPESLTVIIAVIWRVGCYFPIRHGHVAVLVVSLRFYD